MILEVFPCILVFGVIWKVSAPIHHQREIDMKKVLLVMFIVLFTAASVFCGEFEDTLKMAEQGDIDSQCKIGDIYYRGDGQNQSFEKAAFWFKKAAIQGNGFATYKLGWMYENGEGVEKDYNQAAFWYKKSAETGWDLPQFNLALMYHFGKGVPQDYKQALTWYTKAAEQGHASAQYNIGLMYAKGIGPPQNDKFAYVWFSLAASQGNEAAIHNRELASTKLSPQQLSEAQDLAAKIQYQIDNPTESQTQPPAKTETGKIIGSGTGFFITNDGYILTCQHVVQDAARIDIYVGDKMYPASLVRSDPNNDLTILKINGSFPALAFSPLRSAKMGQDVFTVGYPNPSLQGVSAKYTKGTVSSLTGFKDDLRLYQISIPIQPGNSGGALLDEHGNILGVVIAMLNAKKTFEISGSLPQNVNYAVKSLYAQAMIDTMPEVAGKLLSPSRGKSDAIDNAQQSTVMVVCYD
jgi:S1-C subfamily serine protease